MISLNVKAWLGYASLAAVTGLLLFIPAGTVRYWQAWVFLAVFFVPVLAITLYLMRKDPKLLERRTTGGPISEKEQNQKIIQSLASLAFIAVVVFPAIDHRRAW